MTNNTHLFNAATYHRKHADDLLLCTANRDDPFQARWIGYVYPGAGLHLNHDALFSYDRQKIITIIITID